MEQETEEKEQKEPKVKVKFAVKKSRLKWKWIRLMDQGDADATTKAMATCLVDENGEFMPFQEAFDMLDDLSLEQMEDAATQFKAAVKDWAVPSPKDAS